MIQKLRTEEWSLDRFKPDERELARHNDPEKTRLFGLDLLSNGLLHAVSAIETGHLICGHGRLLAARSAGIQKLLTNVFPATLTKTEVKLIRGAENLQSTALTGHQKFLIASELLAENPSWKQRDLCDSLHLTEGTVSKILSPSKCIPAWQEALKAGRATIEDCAAASRLPEDEQASLLEFKLSGANREQVRQRAARKPQVATEPAAPKLARVVVALTEASRVTITGPEMTLSGLVDVLTSALSAAKAAAKDQINITTAQKMWADRAKASRP